MISSIHFTNVKHVISHFNSKPNEKYMDCKTKTKTTCNQRKEYELKCVHVHQIRYLRAYAISHLR